VATLSSMTEVDTVFFLKKRRETGEESIEPMLYRFRKAKQPCDARKVISGAPDRSPHSGNVSTFR
jgi:hypothetical protein